MSAPARRNRLTFNSNVYVKMCNIIIYIYIDYVEIILLYCRSFWTVGLSIYLAFSLFFLRQRSHRVAWSPASRGKPVPCQGRSRRILQGLLRGGLLPLPTLRVLADPTKFGLSHSVP